MTMQAAATDGRTRTEPGGHTREQRNILADAERRLLVWLAKRMPKWLSSDHLTALGLCGMLAAGLSFWAARWHKLALLAAIVSLGVNWFGDSLDGTLARVRGKVRPRYGYYVDHVVDVLGTFFLLGGLALSGYMTPVVGLALLLAFLMLVSEVFLATYALGAFRMSFWSLGPTEMRILLAIGVLHVMVKPTVRIMGETYLLFDVGGAVAAAVLALTFLVSALRNGRALYRAETLQ